MALATFGQRLPLRGVVVLATWAAGTALALGISGGALTLLDRVTRLVEPGLQMPLMLACTPLVFGSFFGSFDVLRRMIEHTGRLLSPWHRVAVGADGMRWSGWQRTLFAPWSEVASVSRRADGLSLVLTSGRRLALIVDDGAGLAAAIEKARSAFAQARRVEAPSSLAPDGDARAWISRARALSSEASYRVGHPPPETLVQLAEDPAAPPLARVGSVLALAGATEAQKVRVRVALEDTADEELAAALREAIDGELDERRVAALARR